MGTRCPLAELVRYVPELDDLPASATGRAYIEVEGQRWIGLWVVDFEAHLNDSRATCRNQSLSPRNLH